MVKGIDQLRPSLGVDVQKPNLPTQNQFLLASQQQQVLAQAQAQSNLGSSTNHGDMDPRRFFGLPRGSLNSKDGQSARNDGSICSPGQSSSLKLQWLLSERLVGIQQMKMGHMQHSSSLQPDQLQQQQLQQGGMAQVRFQPRIGNLLAAASDKVVSIFYIETDRQTYSFQGHAEMVNYIFHDGNGGLCQSELGEDLVISLRRVHSGARL